MGQVRRRTIRVCLKMLCTPKPNGFADHYPYEKWLFHWGYTPFADIPIHEQMRAADCVCGRRTLRLRLSQMSRYRSFGTTVANHSSVISHSGLTWSNQQAMGFNQQKLNVYPAQLANEFTEIMYIYLSSLN